MHAAESTRPRSADAGAGGALVGSVIGIALSPGTIGFYTLGLLMEPIMTGTGWSRGEVSFAASVFTTVLLIAIPFTGRAIDRFGVRRVLLPSIALFGIMLAVIGASRGIRQFYLGFVLFAALSAGANSISYMRSVCSWFDRHRGLAIGIAQSGMGIGIALMPPIIRLLLQRGDWSFVYQCLGGIVILLALPVVAGLVHEGPGASRPDSKEAVTASGPIIERATPSDLSAALRQRTFWVLLIGFFLLAGPINTAALHLVPIIQASGADREAALAAASVFGIAMLAGRLLTGVLVDRWFAPCVAAILFGVSSTAIVVLGWGGPTSVSLIAAGAVGLSAGADGDLLSYLVSRYFGLHSFATLTGVVFSAYLAGTAVFPWLAGVMADHWGSYFWPTLGCAGLGFGSVVAMLVLRR